MNINLQQNEIEAALKGYIVQQGINLIGKQVQISFTAGRKGAGISAEFSIEEETVNFMAIPEGPINRELVAVATIGELMKARGDLNIVGEEAEPVVLPEPVEAVKTSSLFG